VHHVGILYDQFMMHGQRNIKLQIVWNVSKQGSSWCELGTPAKQGFLLLLYVYTMYVTSNHTGCKRLMH